MMKYILLIICFLTIEFTFGQTKKYFRHAHLDFYGNCVGIYPISEEQAHTMNYYVFEYDTIQRLYDVKYCKQSDEFGLYSEVLKGIRLSYFYKDKVVQIQSYHVGEDLDDIYEPNPFYWEKYLDASKKVKAIATFMVSELDEEFFEETGRVEYEYDEKGVLKFVKIKGKEIFGFEEDYSATVHLQLNQLHLPTEFFFVYEDSIAAVNEHQIDKQLIEYNSVGQFVSKKSYDKQGVIIPIEQNICVQMMQYDSLGYLAKVANFDSKGDLANLKYYGDDGLIVIKEEPAITTYQHDFRGNLIQLNYFSANQHPFQLQGKIHQQTFQYDSLNNLLVLKNLDSLLQFTLDENGYAELRYAYDSSGKQIEKSFFGLNEVPILNINGVHKIKYTYDNYDFITGESFYNESDQPMEDFSGASKYQYEYIFDESGYGTSITKVYDLNGKFIGVNELVDNQDGEMSFIYRKWIDTLNYSISESWYNEQNQPILNSNNFHKSIFKYHPSNDLLIEEDYFDAQNKLHLVPHLGYAKKVFSLNDTTNRVSEIAFYGAENQLILNRDTVAVIQYRYNQQGNITDVYQLDTARQPILFTTVIYHQVNGYDTLGNLISTWNFNPKKKLMEDQMGFAGYTYQYKDKQITEKRFYSKKKKLKLDQNGVAAYCYEYNDAGNEIIERFKNEKNKLTVNKDSIAYFKTIFDLDGRPISIEARGVNNELKETLLEGKRCARIEYIFEDEEISIKYYNSINEEIEQE